MVEPMDVKDIPLPGEDIHRIEIPHNTQINIFGKQQNSYNPNDSIPDNSLNKLGTNDPNLINNTPNLLSNVISHHDTSQLIVPDVESCVDNIIAETAQFIEKNDSALSQIQQQIETVKIQEKKSNDQTNETQNIPINPVQQEYHEIQEERPQQIVENPQVHQSETEIISDDLIMEATDESFTLTLNLPDSGNSTRCEEQEQEVQQVPQSVENQFVEQKIVIQPDDTVENAEIVESTVENEEKNIIDNQQTEVEIPMEEETIVNQEIQIENVENVPQNEEIIPQTEEVMTLNEEIVPQTEEIILETAEITTQSEDAILQNEEVTSETVETTPQALETSQNEQTPPQIEEATPQSVDTSQVLETTPQVVDNTPQVAETTPPVVETTPPVVETTPPVVETTPSAEEISLPHDEINPQMNEDVEIDTQNEMITEEVEVVVQTAEIECQNMEVVSESVENDPQSVVENVVEDVEMLQNEETVPDSNKISAKMEVTPANEEIVTESVNEPQTQEIVAISEEVVQQSGEQSQEKVVHKVEVILPDEDTEDLNSSLDNEVQITGVIENTEIMEDSNVEQDYIVEKGLPKAVETTKREIISTEMSNQGSETVFVVQEFSEPIVVSKKEIIITQNEVIEKAKPKKVLEKRVKQEKNLIPCHVLGRNIDNPQEDLVSNGRTPPKPRLGVKVPYRHLMSQIVTKQDITNELIEIVNKRNPSPDPPPGGDIFFAQKLTQRLASKIAKSPVLKNIGTSAPVSKKITIEKKTEISDAKKAAGDDKNKAIENKQDLLAILEGDVDVDLAKEVQKSEKNETEDGPPVLTPENVTGPNAQNANNTPPQLRPAENETTKTRIRPPHVPTEIEKSIALKQLEQFRGRHQGRRKQNLQEQVQTRENIITTNNVTNNKNKGTKKENNVKPQTKKTEVNKETQTTKDVIAAEPPVEKVTSTPVPKKKTVVQNPKAENKPAEIDDVPILTRRKVTKTYSRKEPILEVPEDLVIIIDSETPDATKEATKENPDKPTKSKKKEVKKVVKEAPTTKKAPVTEVVLISKRARVIKPKVIWDPDEVPNRKSISPTKKVEQPPKQKSPIKKVEEKPKEPKVEEETAVEEVQPQPEKEKAPKVTKMMKKARVLRLRKGKHILLKKKAKMGEIKKSLMKKKLATSSMKKPVKMSELDRLLMDEGAVNMLYNIRQSQNRKNATTQKEILNRAKLLKDTLTQSTAQECTPKALRKKGKTPSPIKLEKIVQRKKSRDSIRSNNQSPLPSPSFLFSKGAEASRIIRRHSSSSISSDESDTEEKEANKEKPQEDKKVDEDSKQTASVPASATKRKSSSDSKASDKVQKTDTAEKKTDKPVLERLTSAEKRKLSTEMSKNFSQELPNKKTRSSAAFVEVQEVVAEVVTEKSKSTKGTKKIDKLWNEMVKNGEKEEKRTSSRQAALADNYKEISIKKINNLVQIILSSTSNKIKNSLNLQMFNELCEVLNNLSKDTSCNAVLFSSIDNNFCNGIDFSVLIPTSNKDKKLNEAQELAKGLKEFLLALSSFPKPLIAGIQGPALGLGVTMLPVFDLVLASDKATFATPYGHLGQIPEGAVLLNSPHIRGSILTSELIFACRKLTASEALQHGLVTRVLWPDKFQEELMSISQSVAKQSQQCLISTKKLLREPMLSNLSTALETESKLLVEHWTSAECQQNFKKMLQNGNEWW